LSIKLGLAVLVCIFVFSAIPANGQQKGQYIPGQQGLNTGVLPDPGFTYANLTMNYSADTLKNAKGNSVPSAGSYDIWAIENIFFYVPQFKFLGAKLAVMVVASTLANGSLTLGALNFPNVALQAGGEGIADTWVQPNLGLSLIALGTGGLMLASIEHWRVLKELNAGRPRTRTWSLPLSIASLISLIGLTAFRSVLSKMGPF
jgi:hypothetical protein